METAIRWSPSSTVSEQTFLVADVNGRSFKHYRVTKYDGEVFQYETLNTLRKVPPFRAFDWSPHDENLVAIGQWSGEATVLRLNDESQPLSLPIKHQRLCNAVAFSHDALLATGLERVRNDFCLNVWDINRSALTSPSPSSPRPGSRRQLIEPLRQLASSEAITSIKFFSQPEILVAGVKGTCLRTYDLREPTGSPSLQLQTRCVHNIAIDVLDENYFASAAPTKDSTIQIWDRRAGVASTAGAMGSGLSENVQQGPVISYKKPFDLSGTPSQESIWSLKYSKSRSGFLGALASTGSCKVFETRKNYTKSSNARSSQAPSNDYEYNLMPQTISAQRIHRIKPAHFNEKPHDLEADQIASFDFSNLGGPNGRPCAIAMRADQSVDIAEIEGPPPAFSLSSLGSLAVGFGERNSEDNERNEDNVQLEDLLQVISADSKSGKHHSSKSTNTDDHGNKIIQDALTGLTEERHLPNHEAHETSVKFSSHTTIKDALAQLTITRRRCSKGYLFNCKKNAEIVADEPWIRELWTWVGRAKGNAADEGMVAGSIDFSYIGLMGIWNNDPCPQSATRTGTVLKAVDISNAIELLARSLQLPQTVTKETAYPMHRQLCLHTCGLGLPQQELEASVKDLAQQGQSTQAAALAIIHDQPRLAFNALRTSKASSAHRELSLALAGFVKGTKDDTWDETVKEVANEIDDPYARAILALVSYGDWNDLLAETSLPLKYRVGVALMHLDDLDLSKFIESAAAECTKQGDIEGIVLTGLTEKAVPLLQAYILRFHDLQTPVLAVSFASPRYFSDPRIDLWRESYRSLLNTYRLFIQRVQFDVQATKLSVRSSGKGVKPALAPAPRQVSLRCNNCDQALDRNLEHVSKSTTDPQQHGNSSFGNDQHTSIFGDAKSGTVCPKCGRHMPRCIICMMWLGMPASYPSSGPKGSGFESKTGPRSPKQPKANASRVVMKQQETKTAKEVMRDFVAICRRCWHMSHGAHSDEWFEKHDVCAVPGCDCRCADLDGGRANYQTAAA